MFCLCAAKMIPKTRNYSGYVLDWYTNTRGMYFVKHIQGTVSSNIRKELDFQATQARVANAVACSEIVSTAKPKVKTDNE